MRIVHLAAAALLVAVCSSCSGPSPQQAAASSSPPAAVAAPAPAAPPAEFVSVSSTRIYGSVDLMIVRDRSTGCDWLWADGYKAGGLQPRTDAKGPICGMDAHGGFDTVSETRTFGSTDFVVVRDRDTGCEWIWVDAYKAGDLQRRMGPNGQVCVQPAKAGA